MEVLQTEDLENKLSYVSGSASRQCQNLGSGIA